MKLTNMLTVWELKSRSILCRRTGFIAGCSSAGALANMRKRNLSRWYKYDNLLTSLLVITRFTWEPPFSVERDKTYRQHHESQSFLIFFQCAAPMHDANAINQVLLMEIRWACLGHSVMPSIPAPDSSIPCSTTYHCVSHM